MNSPRTNPRGSAPASSSHQRVREERSKESREDDLSDDVSLLSGGVRQPDSLTPNNSDPNRPDEQENTPLADQHRIQPGSVSDVPEANQEAADGAELQQGSTPLADQHRIQPGSVSGVPEANQEATGGAELQQIRAFEESSSKPVYYSGDLNVFINGSDDERPQTNLSQQTSSKPKGSEAPKKGLILGLLEMVSKGWRNFYVLVMLLLGGIEVGFFTVIVVLMVVRFPLGGAPKPSAN